MHGWARIQTRLLGIPIREIRGQRCCVTSELNPVTEHTEKASNFPSVTIRAISGQKVWSGAAACWRRCGLILICCEPGPAEACEANNP